MENETQYNQLLIIGNGFDLYCGLRTSFKDYLNATLEPNKYSILKFWITRTYLPYKDKTEKSEHFSSIITENMDTFEKYELEIILLLIENQKLILWADFEKAIHDLVIDRKKNDGEKVDSIWKEAFLHYSTDTFEFNKPNSVAQIIGMMCNTIDFCGEKKRHAFNEDLWNQRLVKLISDFEVRFADYLIHAVDTSTSTIRKQVTYGNRFRSLISEIVENDYHYKLNILSFNYTQPEFEIASEEFNKIQHVHGKIDVENGNQNIIIGIDSVKLLSNNFGYELTKTYRKAKSFVYNNAEKLVNVLDVENTQIIKFFGHSLNEQDYSYFQSVFDLFSLYDSKVELKFYFTVYDKSRETEIRNTAIKQIVSLMEAYGKTLSNKDQGKNLLHKLLLTNRLSINEIHY